jgi:hypothetical protein
MIVLVAACCVKPRDLLNQRVCGAFEANPSPNGQFGLDALILNQFLSVEDVPRSTGARLADRTAIRGSSRMSLR